MTLDTTNQIIKEKKKEEIQKKIKQKQQIRWLINNLPRLEATLATRQIEAGKSLEDALKHLKEKDKLKYCMDCDFYKPGRCTLFHKDITIKIRKCIYKHREKQPLRRGDWHQQSMTQYLNLTVR